MVAQFAYKLAWIEDFALLCDPTSKGCFAVQSHSSCTRLGLYYYYYYYVSSNYYCTTRLATLLQSVLLCVSLNSLLKVFVAFDRSRLILILLRSCRIFCIHVIFGLPCGLLTFLRYSSKKFLAGVSEYRSHLI